MKNIISKIILLTSFFGLLTVAGCKKFLDEKSSKIISTLSTLRDMQALMDNFTLINFRDGGAGEASADDSYLSDDDFLTMAEFNRNLYTWEKENLFSRGFNDWAELYRQVNLTNQILFTLKDVVPPPSEQETWNTVKGHALFLRGRCFQLALSIWAKAYDKATAGVDPGIPLRLDPEFTSKSVRSTVEQGYQQVLADLKEAAQLLPVKAVHPLRPNKAAALGITARTFLWMREYDSCFTYAQKSLALNSDLLDYNSLDGTEERPFASIQYINPEVSIYFLVGYPQPVEQSRAIIDSALYNSYAPTDLRPSLFYFPNPVIPDTYLFKSGYSGNDAGFGGCATDEVLLMQAECNARAGRLDAALANLNKLLIKRFSNSVPYVPITAATPEAALQIILRERRKELVRRNLRWMDIKRLNKEGANIILHRRVAGKDYTLLPNDKRYALAIPEEVIALSGMEQNDR